MNMKSLKSPSVLSKFLGGKEGRWGGLVVRKVLEVGWWWGVGVSLRDLSKNILKQWVGKGKSCL